jgi:hypothetical protein
VPQEDTLRRLKSVCSRVQGLAIWYAPSEGNVSSVLYLMTVDCIQVVIMEEVNDIVTSLIIL